jgi:hypothetical protein
VRRMRDAIPVQVQLEIRCRLDETRHLPMSIPASCQTGLKAQLISDQTIRQYESFVQPGLAIPCHTNKDLQVSPYNLWSVRYTRYLTIFLTLIGFAWWILLLVSTFVTPPGFHTRGSGFFPLSFASLALANLLLTLLFFAVPSKAVRVTSLITAALLLVNAIILISVRQTRHEEGWVGMASVLCKQQPVPGVPRHLKLTVLYKGPSLRPFGRWPPIVSSNGASTKKKND